MQAQYSLNSDVTTSDTSMWPLASMLYFHKVLARGYALAFNLFLLTGRRSGGRRIGAVAAEGEAEAQDKRIETDSLFRRQILEV